MEIYCKHNFFNCDITSMKLKTVQGAKSQLRFFAAYITFPKYNPKTLRSHFRSTSNLTNSVTELDTVGETEEMQGFHRCNLLIPLNSLESLEDELETMCSLAQKLHDENSENVMVKKDLTDVIIHFGTVYFQEKSMF